MAEHRDSSPQLDDNVDVDEVRCLSEGGLIHRASQCMYPINSWKVSCFGVW